MNYRYRGCVGRAVVDRAPQSKVRVCVELECSGDVEVKVQGPDLAKQVIRVGGNGLMDRVELAFQAARGKTLIIIVVRFQA